jgi:drug/metabolite transporter (DMT)-like permease
MAGMERRGFALALLGVLAVLWGSSFAFINLGVQGFGPITFIGLRCAIAAAVLYAVMRLRGIAMPTDGASWRAFGIQAGLATVTPFLLIAWGSKEVASALAVVLASTSPIFAFLLGFAFRRAERPGWRKGLGVTLGIAGVAAIVGHQGLGGGSLWHMLAIVFSGALFALSGYTGLSNFQDKDPIIPALGAQCIGIMVLLPLGALIEAPWNATPSASAWLGLFGLALFSTAAASVIWFRLLRTLGVVATTSQAYLRVPVGAAIGVLLLGEAFPWAAMAGTALVMAGVALMTLRAPERRPIQRA